jgi:succinoglycan biosynthesis protein ExoM
MRSQRPDWSVFKLGLTVLPMFDQGSITVPTKHISICICTFKRPKLLRQLLERLENQRTDGLFTYSVVVADNDPAYSAQQVVAALSSTFRVHLAYCHEAQQNIALARNRALENAEGDFIAFIDDDEFPEDDWLYNLFKTCEAYGVDGVLGPVNPHFESEPPGWVKKGKFFDRPTFDTGYRVNWDEARTGNVLFKRDILNAVDIPFQSEFATAGEDVDFFRRMMEKGYTFVWCNEAVVHELVPASRCTRSYLLNRALLRGSNFHKHPTHRLKNATKSLIAVPCYTLSLPILALFGQHLFLKYLIKLVDHSSRLLAYLGLSLVTRRQT